MKCVSAFLQEMTIDQLQAAGAGPRVCVCVCVCVYGLFIELVGVRMGRDLIPPSLDIIYELIKTRNVTGFWER